jgi:hypothetical protein
MSESEMCTCVEDLYWAEIRVPLGPTVLLGVGALLAYRLWKFVAITEDVDDESVMSGSQDADQDAESSDQDAESSDHEDEPADGLTCWDSKVPNVDEGTQEIFPEDDSEYEVSLIDAPTPGPTPSDHTPDVISSTEEASSDTVPPSPETDETPSVSSPPGDV